MVLSGEVLEELCGFVYDNGGRMGLEGVGRPERHERGSCISAKNTGMRTLRLADQLGVECVRLSGVERRNMGTAECTGLPGSCCFMATNPG